MKIRNIIFLMLTVALYSCEDVIELELTETDIKPVIVGEISDESETVEVSVTRSSSFYDIGGPELISDAKVMLSTSEGANYDLVQTSPGIYRGTDVDSRRGESYTLEVSTEGSSYSAVAAIPSSKIGIDSISLEFEEESLFQKEGIFPVIYYNDPQNEVNYYRFIAKVNGEFFNYNWDEEDKEPHVANAILLNSDKFSNGGIQDFDLNYHLKKGDILTVEMQHLDVATYDYLRTLSEVGNGSGVAPADPISNFGSDALGYFGAYSSMTYSVTVD